MRARVHFSACADIWCGCWKRHVKGWSLDNQWPSYNGKATVSHIFGVAAKVAEGVYILSVRSTLVDLKSTFGTGACLGARGRSVQCLSSIKHLLI